MIKTTGAVRRDVSDFGKFWMVQPLQRLAGLQVIIYWKNRIGIPQGVAQVDGCWLQRVTDSILSLSYPLVNVSIAMEKSPFLMGKCTLYISINDHFQKLCESLPEGKKTHV